MTIVVTVRISFLVVFDRIFVVVVLRLKLDVCESDVKNKNHSHSS